MGKIPLKRDTLDGFDEVNLKRYIVEEMIQFHFQTSP